MSSAQKYVLESPKRRPRRAAEESQRQILDIAVEHIADGGFHKVAIADVAAASNVAGLKAAWSNPASRSV